MPDMADHAESIADLLHKCMKGFGTDEDGVYKALKQVESQEMWDEVQKQFKARHADMAKGDLKKALEGELTKDEEKRAKAALKENSVEWDGKAAAKPQQPDKQQPQQQQQQQQQQQEPAAEGGQKGGNIMREERELFDKRMGLGLDDHRKELKSDMDDFEARCAAISERASSCGGSSVGYGSPSTRPHGTPSTTASSPPRERVDQEHAETLAGLLHKCMKGFGTDEDGVYSALHQVETQAMWQAVQQQFRKHHADMQRGDLKKALASELSSKEEVRAKDALKENGVAW